MVNVTKYKTPPGPTVQPQREQPPVEPRYWDREDIMEAIRNANLRGIPAERMFHRATPAVKEALIKRE